MKERRRCPVPTIPLRFAALNGRAVRRSHAVMTAVIPQGDPRSREECQRGPMAMWGSGADALGGRRFGLTGLESRLDAWARRRLAAARNRGVRAFLIELAAFVVKQAWATLFGFLLLGAIVAARVFYPDGLGIARNDLLTVTAILIQIAMVVTGLETRRELRALSHPALPYSLAPFVGRAFQARYTARYLRALR